MPALTPWQRTRACSLFGRIDEGASIGSLDKSSDLLTSLKQNLNDVLNSRPGCCQSSPELGVVDFNDATGSSVDISASVCKAIQQCIENFDPRIKSVDVATFNKDSDPLTLFFRVKAHIQFEDIDSVVNFNIQLDDSSRYQLR
ncbi:type VI secretion system baseplate subunit TssE [Hafnia alvei]|jgi:type VI secretion system protein|uniref:type VI secretion system baseplate subunit TssE n=1 Tax=Hafnia TaxID=568 RepID=UPI000BBAC330|nr:MULTISPECIES: type VI secretion system baseplate subunit TssE [Hafnia]QIP57026.1 type VI secretion system baseplate subunit TssE [Hafnia alvei]TBL85698.1 type VI secretion system baseplate subunit TssE [Hafnia alvei]